MTEAEWTSSAELRDLLLHVNGNGAERKLRLFAVACCRQVAFMVVPEVVTALGVAELVADGLAGDVERKNARASALGATWVSDVSLTSRRGPAKASVCDALERRAIDAAIGASYRVGPIINRGFDRTAGYAVLRVLLRDIFGNPFRPVAFDSAWRSSTVTSLAEAIYAERAFDRLPILADALEDAGCTSADVLEHCRQPGEHVRGCWVVDLVLEKD